MLDRNTFPHLKVALIEDCEEDRQLYKYYLGHSSIPIKEFEFSDAQTFFDWNKSHKVDCLLLDYNLPDMDGLEFIKQFNLLETPVIIITGQGNEQIAAAAFKQGVYDYIVKSKLSQHSFLKTLYSCLQRFEMKQTIQKKNKEVFYQATHDLLTDFFNRDYFKQQVNRMLTKAYRYKERIACFYLDLDYFKDVNDSHGHEVGDRVLMEFSKRLKNILRKEDIVARLGGDEFGLVIDVFSSELDLAFIAKKIIQLTNRSYDIEGYEIKIGVSIGIYVYDGKEVCDYDQVMRFADNALYTIKHKSKNNFAFYSKSMEENFQRQMYIETHFDAALKKGKFSLKYQPIYELASKKIIGFEVISFWKDDHFGTIREDEFLPVLENLGQTFRFRLWMCQQVIELIQSLGPQRKVFFSINLIAASLSNPQFIKEIEKVCTSHSMVDTQLVRFEIKESELIQASKAVMDGLQTLTKMGFQISLDDFGADCSCLQDLCSISFGTLKLSNKIVHGIHVHPKNQKVARSIIALAGTVQANVVALGVQSKQEEDVLLDLGCFAAQSSSSVDEVSLEQIVVSNKVR